MAPRLVVIVGPTASGKSALAVRLARACGGEILSADSQQVYRGMDIGTGKVDQETRDRVPHHLIDVIDPDDEMTAARFVQLADAAIEEIAGRRAPVVVAGGTMLYVRVLLYGLFEGPPADPELRERLDRHAREHGLESLHRRLAQVDPDSAARIHATDQRRMVRALEVFEKTGRTMSEHQEEHRFGQVPARYPTRVVGLSWTREELYRRIDSRVDQMMASGLLDEVRELRRRGFGSELRSQQAIGYAELHRHLDDDLDLDQAVELIKRNSRRYSRRQLSWYRSDPTIEWTCDGAEVDLDRLRRYARASSGTP